MFAFLVQLVDGDKPGKKPGPLSVLKKMTSRQAQSQIIDLTESFSLADHREIANIVIELDDSMNDSGLSLRTTVRYGNAADAALALASLPGVSISNDVITNKKKSPARKGRGKSPRILAQIEAHTRERSPLRFGDCPICFDELGKNALASTKCGHVFCLPCIEQSLKVEKKCPTCRQALRGNKSYHPLYLNRG